MQKLNILKIPTRCISLSSATPSGNVCWPKPEYGPVDVRRSVLMNGIRVGATKAMGNNTAACTIMFQAGSRYETDQFIGVTHLLRASSQLSGCGYTAYIKSRYLTQHAATITCSSDRQSIAYTLRCPVSCFNDVKNLFLDSAVRCCFNEWEVRDLKDHIKRELHYMPPEQKVLDLVQRACWGGPLSNSMFCEMGRVGQINEDQLNCYARERFRTYCCSVGSVGIPFEDTMSFAESIEFSREKPAEPCEIPSYPRAGFEEYDLGKGSTTWIAVAVPGCGTCDIGCLLKHAIVASACGTGNVQGGQHALDFSPHMPLGMLAGGDMFTSFRAFNISYMETGVFGILAKTRAETAYQVSIAAAQFLCNVGDLTFKQIEIGKNRLKVDLAFHNDDAVLTSEGLAQQLANNVQIDSMKDYICMIDSTPADTVSCVAKSLSAKRAQMAVAVVGDVGSVPNDCDMTCG